MHGQRVLRDQCRDIRRPLGPPLRSARPDALLHVRRHRDEIERLARVAHVQPGILLEPAVVVIVGRGKDGFTPRMIRQPPELPRAHDASRERCVIPLGDQEQSVLRVLDDHLDDPNCQNCQDCQNCQNSPTVNLPMSCDFEGRPAPTWRCPEPRCQPRPFECLAMLAILAILAMLTRQD